MNDLRDEEIAQKIEEALHLYLKYLDTLEELRLSGVEVEKLPEGLRWRRTSPWQQTSRRP